jgi:RNA polymerase sigma-70 factor (ECF subfamily)
VALSEIDRLLLERCLARKPNAWKEFVDRFMGLVIYTLNHTAQSRSIKLSKEDRDDICAEVFLAIIKDDFALLRRFRAQSSLATYLSVVARRIAVREILKSQSAHRLAEEAPQAEDASADFQEQFGNRDEVERLLEELDGEEAELIRLYHLEGKSYQEISSAVGMPENSVGPALSRAREKMRRSSKVSGS